MSRSCPYCKAWLPTVGGPLCPRCGVALNAPPANITDVPSKATVLSNSAQLGAIALILLLVMAGMSSALVRSLGEKDAALSVVFAAVTIACGVVLYITVRRLVGWLRLL